MTNDERTEKLGRYEILEEVGQGGFAIVYRGRDTTLHRQVALKELKPILLNDTGWVKRFHKEAQTIAQLDHPRIVPIYDVHEAEQRLFIVMRFVDGPTLEDFITAKKHLSWSEVLEIAGAVTEGLDYAHAQGVLHRDLKPANILIDAKQGAMLSDFGLAKLTGEHSMSVSASGTVVGTPHYIAPEIWEGEKNSPQADIYALGCILFEMITGEKIFKGDTPPAVMMAHFTPPRLPQSWPPDVPPGVSQVLARALARQPHDRYSSAAEMMDALLTLEVAEPVAMGAVPVTTEEQPAAETTGPAQIEEDALDPNEPPTQDQIKLNADDRRQETGERHDKAEQSEEPTPAQAQPQTAAPLPTTSDNASEGAAPAATEVLSKPRRRKHGCLWAGAAVLFLTLVFTIGLGNFCSTIDSFFNANKAAVDFIPVRTQPIHVPLPDTSDPVKLEMGFGAGELRISPGADGELVTGTAEYNVAQFAPNVRVGSDRISIKPGDDFDLGSMPTEDVENIWDLKLNTFPMALTIDAGIAQGNLELGGLSLTDVDITEGAAEFYVSFSEPNRQEMQDFHFIGGASKATLTGLANTRAEDIVFKGGAGEFILEFTGELKNDIDVNIDALLGKVTIIVPEDTAAAVVVKDIFSETQLDGAWQESLEAEGEYFLPSYTEDGYKIEADVRLGAGTLRLETVPSESSSTADR